MFLQHSPPPFFFLQNHGRETHEITFHSLTKFNKGVTMPLLKDTPVYKKEGKKTQMCVLESHVPH